MFTDNKSAGTSNKNENVLTCDTKAVDVKVERCDDEVQQSEIDLHTYYHNVIKEEMAVGHEVLQHVDKSNCSKGESLSEKPSLDTEDKTTEPGNTAKQTRTETNTEEMTPKDCNENTEPSDAKPMENVKNKIPTKTSKPRNNTQKNIRNYINNETTKNVSQCNVYAKQYDKKVDLAQHIEFHDKTKRDIYFKCKECSYQSVTQCSLERHLKLHDKSRRFVCDVCGYRYMDNTQLQQHLRNVHSDEKIHECGICDYKTNIILNLNTHLRIHTGEKPYSCSQCEFKCNQNGYLRKHSRIHTGEKPYSCSECNYKCAHSSSLKRHIRTHSEPLSKKPRLDTKDKTKLDIYLKCKECTYQSVAQCSLERHLKLHDKSRRFVCDACGYRYPHNAHLQQHLRNVHSDEKIHECGICDYKTNIILNLNRHIRMHSGEKPYSCSHCEFKCSDKSSLKGHSRIHTGEKPYSCSQCEFKCSVKGSLKYHARIHTGEKPYSCSQCEFTCSNKSGLKVHSRIHTGEKPYSCSECNYKCTRSRTLKQHLGTHKTHPATHEKTSEPSQNNNSNDRNGSIIKLETEAMSTVREEPTEELYADHEIKDEMVIGPVVLQAVTCMMEENGEPLRKKPRLDTQDKNTEPDNTDKQTRIEKNTEEMTPNDCNENTEPSATKPMENVKTKYQLKPPNSVTTHRKHQKQECIPITYFA